MKPNVHEVPIKRPDPALIEQLENLLSQAKTGELTGLVYVSVWQGNGVNSGWAGLYSGLSRTILGELAVLNYEIVRNISEEA